MNSLKEIAKLIKKSKSVALFTHASADFDALGSACSLCLALKRKGKVAKLFLNDELLDDQKELYDDIEYFSELDNENYDLYIVVDASGKNVLGRFADIFDKDYNTIIIDHHATDSNIAKYYYRDSKKSSCCEIIFNLLNILKCDIDKTIASYLYAGLSTDSGSFKNTNTNANTFLTAYNLYNLGADTLKINRVIYESTTLREIEFEKYLLNNYKISGKTAYCCFDLKTLDKLNGTKADCTNFSRIMVNIKEVNYGFTLVETSEGEYKLSMRSKSGFNVRDVAQALGGGGHICAAGATIKADSKECAANIVLEKIAELENK